MSCFLPDFPLHHDNRTCLFFVEVRNPLDCLYTSSYSPYSVSHLGHKNSSHNTIVVVNMEDFGLGLL